MILEALANHLAPGLENVPNGKLGLAITMAAADLQAKQHGEQPVHLLEEHVEKHVKWLQRATEDLLQRLAAHQAARPQPQVEQEDSTGDRLPFTPAATPRELRTGGYRDAEAGAVRPDGSRQRPDDGRNGRCSNIEQRGNIVATALPGQDQKANRTRRGRGRRG